MDTAAFIVTLFVFVAVGFWYVENELKQSDGAHGMFAVRQAEKPRKARRLRYADGGDANRFRPRAQPEAPAKGASVAGANAGEAARYRRKERAWDRAAKPDDED